MRLLSLNADTSFSLATFYEGNIPPYAILSHTWGPDEQEVTFQDLTSSSSLSQAVTNKTGYKKLEFCARQAAKNELRYFWIDTCCINKLSDQELSESINSMFRWYQRATVCYVYLSDVSPDVEMRDSRWFTRGWTLQELLAPNRVRFFDACGLLLGSKVSLSTVISSVTRIPVPALFGQSLQSFSVEERLSWAQYRQTKREEDAAYCMLGIFGVSMPLVYGEGREWAYHRLLKEVESRDQTRSLTAKYSQYLPVESPTDVGKAAGEAEGPAPRTDARAPSNPRPLTVQEGEMIWDSNLEKWIRVEWNPQYQLHCRKQYLEGQGWVFLNWVNSDR